MAITTLKPRKYVAGKGWVNWTPPANLPPRESVPWTIKSRRLLGEKYLKAGYSPEDTISRISDIAGDISPTMEYNPLYKSFFPKQGPAFNTSLLSKTVDTPLSAFKINQKAPTQEKSPTSTKPYWATKYVDLGNGNFRSPTGKTGYFAEDGTFITGESPTGAPTQANLMTELPEEERKAIKEQKTKELEDRIANYERQSLARQEEITQMGKVKKGSATSFLAKAGALGRSLSGAPVESGLGVLSGIQTDIDNAINEEKSNLAELTRADQTLTNFNIQTEVQTRLDKLNELAQTNFNNALLKVQEDRAQAQEKRLSETETRKQTQDNLNFLLGFPNEVLSKISDEQWNEFESDLELPTGALSEYIKQGGQSNDKSLIQGLQDKYKDVYFDPNKSYLENLETLKTSSTYQKEIYITPKKSELDELLSPTEAASLNVPYGTTKSQASEMGLTPKTQLTGQEKIQTEINLSKQFDGVTKELRSSTKNISMIEEGWEAIQESMKTGKIFNPTTGKMDKFSLNAPSQVMLVTFQKMLDPTSVVRESEYARSGENTSLINRIQGKFDKLSRGGAGVTVDDLNQFYTMSKQLQGIYKNDLLDFAKRTQYQAKSWGLDINNILTPTIVKDLEEYGYQSDEEQNFLNDPEVQKLSPELQSELYQQLYGKPLSFNKVDGDTNLATGGLTTLNIGNKSIKVDNSISNKLAMADKEFYQSTGKHLQVNQSYRTRQEQQKLYDELSKKGARVAPPGKSYHEKGLAIDVTNWKEAEKVLRKYGFKNDLKDDKGHFSVGEFA